MIGSGAATEGASLAGPSPDEDPLAYYECRAPSGDIFVSAVPEIARMWRTFASGLAAQTRGNLGQIQTYLDRHVDDLGIAFRLTGDEQERPWPLNPMPILIGADEWRRIEAGLVQRAQLLETVIADIYGPQKLIADGHLPPALVSGSSHFARRMVGSRPAGERWLRVLAVDLARGPSGEWRVLADRVRLPVGIGYALENRLAMRRTTGGLLASIGARRQAEFFEALRNGLAAGCAREDPRIGLLTPGRFNQSYPEQALLARHLGISLVEGRDLVVSDDHLFVRTIAGLRRIDALWRWIGTRDIDPLNFDSRSRIGVPNLISACEDGGLALANWPGSGVIESRAMSAFLPRLSRVLTGGPLMLPNAATWWCGQQGEREHVLANLDALVISSAFRTQVAGLRNGRTRAGASLSPDERETLARAMELRPMDYAAQEIVNLSTTPCLVDGHLEPRGFTLRAFLVCTDDGKWVALPGGFGRISEHGDLRTSLMGLGDLSADICILERPGTPRTVAPPALHPPPVRRAAGVLPSQAADNLFWIGRYEERIHQTARVVRTLLETATGPGAETEAGTAVARLAGLLEQWGAIPRGTANAPLVEIAAKALASPDQSGSIASYLGRSRQIALLLRDRLARDSWRVIHRPLPAFSSNDPDSMAAAADILIERFAAFARLTADGMSRGPAWRFLDMGICLERAALIVQSARSMIPGSASAEDLAALLELVDGQPLYRTLYLTMPFIAPVLDMVLFDPQQPRGLAFQIARLVEHIETLPILRDDGMMEAPLRLARRLQTDIEGLSAERIDSAALDRFRTDLALLSDEIARRYFLQHERPDPPSGADLLS